jgi:Sulfotransferase domain
MWSGPRNISTAMMRSWENRPDCSVVDEPFYAAYLARTGLEHPCREAVLESQSTDYQEVAKAMSASTFDTPLQYQKQMTHHIPADMDLNWCRELKHCFLIRDPAQVIASYLQKMPDVDESAIGIRRQAQLFANIWQITGTKPAVIDSNDVLQNPAKVLAGLCEYLQIDFLRESMLHWPTGSRSSDGVWASHWYHNVEQSTGFGKYKAGEPTLAEEHQALADAMYPYYTELASLRISP